MSDGVVPEWRMKFKKEELMFMMKRIKNGNLALKKISLNELIGSRK